MQNLRALGASPPDPQNSPPFANFWLRACVEGYIIVKVTSCFLSSSTQIYDIIADCTNFAVVKGYCGYYAAIYVMKLLMLDAFQLTPYVVIYN